MSDRRCSHDMTGDYFVVAPPGKEQHMKAAVLEEFGWPGTALTIRDVRDPSIGTGEVLVDVLATGVAPYAAEVFSGERNYPLEPPVISGVGGIGRVVATGPDAT